MHSEAVRFLRDFVRFYNIPVPPPTELVVKNLGPVPPGAQAHQGRLPQRRTREEADSEASGSSQAKACTVQCRCCRSNTKRHSTAHQFDPVLLKRPGMVGNLWLTAVEWSEEMAKSPIGFSRVPVGPRTGTEDPFPTEEMDLEYVRAQCRSTELHNFNQKSMQGPFRFLRPGCLLLDGGDIADGTRGSRGLGKGSQGSATDPEGNPERTTRQRRVDEGAQLITNVWINRSAYTYVFFESRLNRGLLLVDVMVEYLNYEYPEPGTESPYRTGEFGYTNRSLVSPLKPWNRVENKADWLHRYSGFFPTPR